MILSDHVFARLLTFPNVIIIRYQALFRREAFWNIAVTTIDNIASSRIIRRSRSWQARSDGRNRRTPLRITRQLLGFCFAKIAWQFALYTHDGCCFVE